MKKHKPFNLPYVMMIAILVIVILIPLLMSNSGKTVDSWTEATDMTKTSKKLKALKSLEALESLEGLPEIQAEMDSILASINIPEMDSFLFIIPELPMNENGKKSKPISIKKSKGYPSYTVPPKIIGGYDSILEHLVYPEKLKKNEIEGTVIVQAHVETDGSVSETRLLNSSGYDLFDEAALEALMKIKFEHVIQDSEAVAVWVALPVMFKLNK